jgi:hypothetical protein
MSRSPYKNQYTLKDVYYEDNNIVEVHIKTNHHQAKKYSKPNKIPLNNNSNIITKTILTNASSNHSRNLSSVLDINKKDNPFLNRSIENVPKGISKGMFSYPKTLTSSRSITRVDKYLTPNDNFEENNNSQKTKKVGFNLNPVEIYPPKNFIDSSQYMHLRNLSLDKYKINNSNMDISSISAIRSMNKDSSDSSFKFDLSKYRAGNASKATIDINNDLFTDDKITLDASIRSSPLLRPRDTSSYIRNLTDSERENRRMLIELIKLKMKKKGLNSPYSLMDEMKLDTKILDNNINSTPVNRYLTKSPSDVSLLRVNSHNTTLPGNISL